MRDWTTHELADEAGTTQRWITELCTSGTLEGAYKRAGVWFIPYESGQQWLDEREMAASSPEEEDAAS
jgi:hypothetical protein